MAPSKPTKAKEGAKTSVSEKVETFVKQAIFRGYLYPHERIIEDDVARRLHVSRGTVREALLRLERDGLVLTTRRHGTYIRAIHEHEFKVVFGMRGKLEGLCVRYMREAAKPETETVLRKNLRKLKSAAARNDDGEFFRADMELHRTIWKLSGQPLLFRTLNQVISPFIFLVARTYSSVVPIKDRFENHNNYVDLILQTPLNRLEREVERYFEELCKASFHPLLLSEHLSDSNSWLREDFSS